MSLQQALDDCLIDFDRRVLVTDLLEKYKLTYREAHEVLEAYIKKQESESTSKYEKRFVVHGMQATGADELYTIVQGEEKLKEWLSKLQNAQSQLYSVEVAGGSKSAAPIFKPMQHVEVKLAKLEQRAGAPQKPATNGLSNGAPNGSSVKVEVARPSNIKQEPSKTKVEAAPHTESKQKVSPSEQKGKAKATPTAANKKGGINNYFSAAPATKSQPVKETKPAAAKTGSMQSFLQKQSPSSGSQTKKSPTSTIKNETAAAKNTSVQLFDTEDAESSDEEEKLDKLRRKVVGSGDESDEPVDKPTVSKRRRIIDSDDEEQPQKKAVETQQAKESEQNEESMDTEEAVATNETFLDDDGFVITVKPKKQTQTQKKKTSPAVAAAAAATPASASATKKKSPPAAASKGIKDTPKTKQGSIMSFFSKK